MPLYSLAHVTLVLIKFGIFSPEKIARGAISRRVTLWPLDWCLVFALNTEGETARKGCKSFVLSHLAHNVNQKQLYKIGVFGYVTCQRGWDGGAG